jgi:hypothetical protein
MIEEESPSAPNGSQRIDDHSVETTEMIESGAMSESAPTFRASRESTPRDNGTPSSETSREAGQSSGIRGDTQTASTVALGEKNCRYCSQPIRSDAKVCHHCQRHQRWVFQHFWNTPNLISIIVMMIAFGQLWMANEERAEATEALARSKEAQRVAQETVTELNDARRKLLELAKVSGSTMLTELMAGNFIDGTTLGVRLNLCDRIIGALRGIGLSEDEITDAKEVYAKGLGVIYHWAIQCALEGRTNPNEINIKASPELRRASDEFGKMVKFPEWEVPSPDEMQSFIEQKGFMNEDVESLIDDYRQFLKTGNIQRREVLEAMRDREL